MLSNLLVPNVQAGTEMLDFLQKSLVRAEAKTQTLFHHSQFSSLTIQKADKHFNVIAALLTTVILVGWEEGSCGEDALDCDKCAPKHEGGGSC